MSAMKPAQHREPLLELEFYGAAGGVTGSCHVLRVEGRTLLLDCGLVQGSRKEEQANREPFPFAPDDIDAVVLSHAHIDHSGRLPLLVQQGYSGPIYTQNATRDLCRILLADAASLAERDADYENRKRAKRNDEPVEPLFTAADASAAVELMQGLRYGETREILPGITLRYQDAGHILGSCVVEILIELGGLHRKLVFSGDLGQYDMPILNDPTAVAEADLVIMESTYGDRLHRDRAATLSEIGDIIKAARHDRGNILIPAFAIGRTQDILYYLGTHFEEWGLDRWTVFLDSPMAIQASQVYWNYPQLYDEEATRLRHKAAHMPELRNLFLTASVEESMAINRIDSGAIIIAGSGMCNGGRIVHHLKRNVGRKECHVIIPGYQAKGTIGRRLVDGEPTIRIHGDHYPVRAQIHTVGGLSAHADRDDLVRWLSGFKNRPDVYLVHGEQETLEALRGHLTESRELTARVATPGMRVDLATGAPANLSQP